MYAAERQQRIVSATRAEGRVEVTTLARTLDVTAETIRRDLAALESRGLVRRVHGGALSVHPSEFEPAVETRTATRVAHKQQIAEAALPLVDDGVRSVLLDAGTTTSALAHHLLRLARDGRDLTVVTNSLPVASVLADEPRMHLHLLGGRVRSRTMAAVGPSLAAQAADVVVDIAFLGTNGLHPRHGLTTPNDDEAAAKRALAACADSVVVLADSSKIGQTHLCRVMGLDAVDTLVTDAEVDAETRDEITACGVEVIAA